MAVKRNNRMKDLIKDSIKEMEEGEFPEDPRLDAEQLSGPERFVKKQTGKDEVVIDSLLADIQGKAGYFLKLKKEVRPNEYMLMKVIESDWRKWADMETSVADVVKEHTKISPQKWGTGSYRIEFGVKGGLRGKTYDPIDFYINAEEEFLNTAQANGTVQQGHIVDPNVAVASKLEELRTLVDVIGGIMPKAQDPSTVQNQIAQAFQQGMSIKSSESNSSTQMMTALITGMMGMLTTIMQGKNEPKVVNPEDTMAKMLGTLKDFGVLGNQQREKEKTVIDLLNELKTIGVEPFKKDDPLESIGKLKQIASIAGQLMGMGGEGEKPSILEKIIDVVGPAIPKMINDIKETATNAATAQALAGQNMERARVMAQPNSGRQISHNEQRVVQPVQPIEREETTYERMKRMEAEQGETTVQQTEQPVVNEQVKQFFDQTYMSVKQNNRMFYPVIYTSLLNDAKGVELLQGVLSGVADAKSLINLLQEYGDKRFKDSEFVMKALVPYVNGFIMWLKQMNGQMEPQQTVKQENVGANEFVATCSACGQGYTYDSEQDFNEDESKTCEVQGCGGTLESIKKAV